MRKAAKLGFDQLHQQSQKNLIRFLQLELELGQTMGKLFETTKSQDHRVRLLRNVREAIRTIHQFEGRIDDASIRAELDRGAASLQQFISFKDPVITVAKKPTKRAQRT